MASSTQQENFCIKQEGLRELRTPHNRGCDAPDASHAPRSNQGRRSKHAHGGGGGGGKGDLSPGMAVLSSALSEVDLNRQHPGRSSGIPAAQLRTPPPQHQQMGSKSSKSRAVSIGFERFLEWKAKQSSSQQQLSCEAAIASSSSSSSIPSSATHKSPGSAQVPPSVPQPLEPSLASAAAVPPSSEAEATTPSKDCDHEVLSSPLRETAEATANAEGAQAVKEEEEVPPGPRWEGFDFDGADDDDEEEEEEDTRWKWGGAVGEDSARRTDHGGDIESLGTPPATYRQAEPETQDDAISGHEAHIGQQAAVCDEGASASGDRSKAVKWTLKLPVWPITLEVAVGVRRTISDPSEMPLRVPDPEAPPLYPPVSQLLRGHDGRGTSGPYKGDEEAPALREVLEPPPFEIALAAAAARLSHWSSTIL